ncbi:hypothetical protein [Simkania sp.]|uniref:hypothetical protein n=1 Tax=Simkania sp. TaxID=34094 RepID=UPI003B522D68
MSASQVTKPNTDFWSQAEKAYNDVTTSRPWRHTVGRISCAVRIPFYALAAIFQVAKMAIKFLPAIPFTIIACATGTRKLDSWTFKGIALDGVVALKFLDKIGSSAIGVICAPPKNITHLQKLLQALESSQYLESIKMSGKLQKKLLFLPA